MSKYKVDFWSSTAKESLDAVSLPEAFMFVKDLEQNENVQRILVRRGRHINYRWTQPGVEWNEAWS